MLRSALTLEQQPPPATVLAARAPCMERRHTCAVRHAVLDRLARKAQPVRQRSRAIEGEQQWEGPIKCGRLA